MTRDRYNLPWEFSSPTFFLKGGTRRIWQLIPLRLRYMYAISNQLGHPFFRHNHEENGLGRNDWVQNRCTPAEVMKEVDRQSWGCLGTHKSLPWSMQGTVSISVIHALGICCKSRIPQLTICEMQAERWLFDSNGSMQAGSYLKDVSAEEVWQGSTNDV